MDEQPFLDAIRARPDDETHRLIYADWLEERGDPLAELIRIEVEMRRISIFDPHYWELKERRNELRELIDEERRTQLGYGGAAGPMFQQVPLPRMERWKLLDRFVDAWNDKPLARDSGASVEEILSAERRLGRRLPAAVREFYYLMGNRLEIGSHQDRFLPVDELLGNEWGPLTFRVENQQVCIWTISGGESQDPPVWCDDEFEEITERRRRRWRQRECDQFSEFVLISIVYETIQGCAMGGWMDHPEFFAEVQQTFSPARFSGSYWFMHPVRFYEGPDILLNTSETDGFLYVAFRRESAIEQLSDELRGALEMTS